MSNRGLKNWGVENEWPTDDWLYNRLSFKLIQTITQFMTYFKAPFCLKGGFS